METASQMFPDRSTPYLDTLLGTHPHSHQKASPEKKYSHGWALSYFIEIHVFLKAPYPWDAALNRLSIFFSHSQLDFAQIHFAVVFRSGLFFIGA